MKLHSLIVAGLVVTAVDSFIPVSADSDAVPDSSANSTASSSAVMSCSVAESVLSDIQSQRAELERQVRALAEREKELNAREAAIAEQFKKIEGLRAEILGGDEKQQAAQAEKVAKLVEAIESMSPKAASVLLGGVEERLAITAMSQLATPKLAKIMNVMEPQKSTRLAEGLAGVAPSRTPANQSAAQNSKGGENTNDRNRK